MLCEVVAALQCLCEVDHAKAVGLDDADIFVGFIINLLMDIGIARAVIHAAHACAAYACRLVDAEMFCKSVERIDISHGSFLASLNERIDCCGREACCSVAFSIDWDIDVGIFLVSLVELHAVEVEHAHHDVECAVGELIFCHGSHKVNADDNVGTHISCHIHRIVIDHKAIDEGSIAHLDRSKHRWDGHAASHSRDEIALVEHMFLARDGIGSYACEADRELAEVAVVGQSVGEMIEQQRDIPAVDDATAASARKHA